MNAKSSLSPADIDFVISSTDSKTLIRIDPLKLLIVDDDTTSAYYIAENAKNQGHSVHIENSGHAAIEYLLANKHNVDTILMDRIMPEMDGLATIRLIKKSPELRNIPIIMITGTDIAQGMEYWLREGVIYYITKPIDDYVLSSVLAATSREIKQTLILSNELQKHSTNFELIDTCRFRFQTLAQAESLSGFIALCFPDPQRVLSGLGELMINAVEHGNLGIGYTRKSELIEKGIWRSEIERREKLDINRKKFVNTTIKRQDNGVCVVIEDEGAGFDWKKYLNIDLVRAGHNHGRGIAQSRAMCFDKLTYNNEGNQAIGFVHNASKIHW